MGRSADPAVNGILKTQPDFVDRQRAYQREYYLRNREILKARSARRYEERGEEIRAVWRAKSADRRKMLGKPSRRQLKKDIDSRSKEYRRIYHVEICVEQYMRNRFRALQKVSGLVRPKCARCGLMDWRALEINHIAGGGGKELRRRGFRNHSKDIISGARKTDDLNVLCASCNKVYEYERGRRRLPNNWEVIVEEEVSRASGV